MSECDGSVTTCLRLGVLAAAQPHSLHRDCSDTGLHLALRAMPVANYAVMSVRQLHALYAGQERVSFGVDYPAYSRRAPLRRNTQAWQSRVLSRL